MGDEVMSDVLMLRALDGDRVAFDSLLQVYERTELLADARALKALARDNMDAWTRRYESVCTFVEKLEQEQADVQS